MCGLPDRIISAIGKWEYIQEWLHGGRGVLPCGQIGHCGLQGSREAKSETFVGEKEERTVFENRAADGSSKIILSFFRFRKVCKVPKPIVGIQDVITQIIKR